ncbi:MAG: V-type ATPase subunit [Dorea sp.]|jgi:V/A-type H+-transporting ATPase subunit C|nr:V-type ATPase subunit [Dorea sp.]
MGNLRTYSGITTKIRAMQAKLLTAADYNNIANLRTVLEVIEYLKEKPAYTKYINRMDTSLYHRGDVEKVLTQSFYDDYTRIFRFVGMEQKKFLKTYWKRYEIDLINYCLRIVFNHYDVPFDIDYKKEIFDKYSQLSVSKLVLSRNVEELVDNLKGTEYYSPLQTLRESGAATLYDYDLTLELYYFSMMWKEEKRLLKGKERELFIKDYGIRIDLTNLQWIYRAKKYYNMLPPDIYMMMIPIQYRFSKEEFKALVEAPSVEEFIKQVGNTRYGKKISFEEGHMLEQQCREILKAAYLSDRRRNPYSVASINAYLFLKEGEIRNIVSALECIRYGLSSRDISGYLGGVIQ